MALAITTQRHFRQIEEASIKSSENFEHLRYVRGYYLTDRPHPALGEHWKRLPLGEYNLGWDGRTESALVSDSVRSIVVIGKLFHLQLNSASIVEIAEHLLRARSFGEPAYNRALYDLSGRYVVIDHGPEGTFLQTDATGMRSAYYAKGGGTVSSHAGLTAEILGDKSLSPFGVKKWFRLTKAPSHPGRATEYTQVYMLTPNTELRVETSLVRRVGPSNNRPHLTAEEAAIELIPHLQNQIGALVKEGRPLMSLTAGLDTRTSLAVSFPFRHDISYFSYVTYRGNEPSPSEPDMILARQICKDFNLDFKTLVISDFLAGGPLNDVIRENSFRIHAPSIAKAYLEQLPSDSIHIRSNIYEIGRAFFRNASSADMKQLTAEEFAKRVIRVKSHESFKAGIEAFEDWMAAVEFDEVEGYDPYDLYYWEFRMGRWLPAHLTESDISHDTYTIVNCRRILELFLAVPLEDRISGRVFDAIIAFTWPELFKYPVNGEMRTPALESLH